MAYRHVPATLFLCAALLAGCGAGVRNYPDPAGPRFTGLATAAAVPDRVLQVVTFNVKFSRKVDRAISLLREEPRLASADVIALQEMNEAGVARMAEALNLGYVYYPGAVHPQAKGHFGNAILTRWPMGEDRKVVLPHPGRLRQMQRIAVGATVHVEGVPVRVYSVHLETPFSVSGGQRRAQIAAVLQDAGDAARVVIAGDFNNTGVVTDALHEAGYQWLNRGLGATISRFAWDHVFSRGFPPGRAAVIRNNRGASDHRPVWAEIPLPPA